MPRKGPRPSVRWSTTGLRIVGHPVGEQGSVEEASLAERIYGALEQARADKHRSGDHPQAGSRQCQTRPGCAAVASRRRPRLPVECAPTGRPRWRCAGSSAAAAAVRRNDRSAWQMRSWILNGHGASSQADTHKIAEGRNRAFASIAGEAPIRHGREAQTDSDEQLTNRKSGKTSVAEGRADKLVGSQLRHHGAHRCRQRP